MDLFTQPLSPAALAVVTVLCLAAIVLLLRLGRKQSRAVSAKFLAAHPDAATLYIYAQDLDPAAVCDAGKERILPFYGAHGNWHRAYTGEVVEAYSK